MTTTAALLIATSPSREGQLLAARQQVVIDVTALGGRHRHLAVVGRHVGDLLVIEHVGEGHHAGVLAAALLEVVQLLGDVVGVHSRQARPGFATRASISSWSRIRASRPTPSSA